jgi:hypothetical protein
MRRVLRLAALIAACSALGVGFVVSAQAGNQNPPGHGGTPPGQEPCSHGLGELNGNAGPCKPDPQPDRGKDCEAHGKVGGKNEDHCADSGGEDGGGGDGTWIG